jgi:hypothetical protein
MTCCGDKRKSINGFGFTSIRYTGHEPRKITGYTRKVYRFDGYGSVIAIDNRDVDDILTLPDMKVYHG